MDIYFCVNDGILWVDLYLYLTGLMEHACCSCEALLQNCVFVCVCVCGFGPGWVMLGFGPGWAMLGFGPGWVMLGFGPGCVMLGFGPGWVLLGFGAHLPSLQWVVFGGCFLGLMWLSVVDLPPLSSSKVKNECIYTSVSMMAFYGLIFTFT